MDREQYKFPDEIELETKGKPLDDDTISIEIEDDTPPEDRNKEPMPAEKVRALEAATDEEGMASERALRSVFSKLRLAYVKRAEQARRVVEHIKTSPYPVIVCGDFNDTPMSYTYNQFNRFLKDAFRQSSSGIGSTYIGRLPAGRIDYLFYDPGLTTTGFNIQKEEFSDHRALVCTFSRVK